MGICKLSHQLSTPRRGSLRRGSTFLLALARRGLKVGTKLRVSYQSAKIRSSHHHREDNDGQHERDDRDELWNRFAAPMENETSQRCGPEHKDARKGKRRRFLVLLDGRAR